MHNIKLLLAFDGTEFHGWQVQPGKRTLQGCLLDAIEQITGTPVSLIGCGRTDAGVHAREHVASFATDSGLSVRDLVRALNAVLPRDLRVLGAAQVPEQFHARRDARSKIYRYQVYRGAIMPPHLRREYFHFPYRIDPEKIIKAAAMLVGEHDYASFAAKSGKLAGQDRNTVRRIFRSAVRIKGHRLTFEFEGNGFLHHMVRNMAGTLLEVGREQITLPELKSLFKEKDRTRAGFTAPAHGLILAKVKY
jgi:tRNA pseudouridine38-40 synthase